MGKYNNDYKVPKDLAKKLVKEYSASIWYDAETEEVEYEETLEAFAENILRDYSEDKIKRIFGYAIYEKDEMVEWLRNNLPELYEILLIKNKEL